MRMIFKIIQIAFLISKYRILDQLVASGGSFVQRFFYKLFTFCFYPINIFRIFSPVDSSSWAELFKRLGPIYIKFGQTLSTRPDVIGADLCSSLRVLQDSLQPFSFEIVKATLQAELGCSTGAIFLYIDEKPVASASIAQVHKAVLLSGEEAAVKILRPDIYKSYKQNLQVLSFLAKLLEKSSAKFKQFRLVEVVKVFEDCMSLELDLRLEASSASELKDNLAKDRYVFLPQVYWQFTTRSILVTQWIDGISIYNTDQIRGLGLDLTELSQNMAIMFFNQTYRDGFFHADLHPGNVFVMPDGRIGLVDFGIMGRLSDKDRFSVAQILHAFLKRDYMKVAKIHVKAGYIPEGTDLARFSQYCRAVCEPIVGFALKDVSISKILNQMFEVIGIFGLEIQPQLVLLQKSMVIIEGIGKSLNPNINMWELAYPWMEEWAAKNISFEAAILAKIKSFVSNELLKI